MSKEKRKGSLFEVLTLEYLKSRGHKVRRNPPMGIHDEGDLVMEASGMEIVLECKNHKTMELSQWVDESFREKDNAHAAFCAVVHHRRGRGASRMGDSYVTMTLSEFSRLIGWLS